MSVDTEYKRAEGVYAVPRRGNDTSVLMGVLDEDLNKVEGAADDQELSPIIPGMFGLLAGKIDDLESAPDTLSRELIEERKLVKLPEVFTNSLPTAQVLQQRQEAKLLFTVHGHRFDITDAEISRMNVDSPTWEVSDARLGEFLLEEQKLLRPSVFAILKLLYQHLENGERI